MGLDFRIDTTPVITMNGEPTTQGELSDYVADLDYVEAPTKVVIEITPLPEVKMDRGARARWSYGGFSRFREKVAESLGFDINTMWGFGPDLTELTRLSGLGGQFPVHSEENKALQYKWWRKNSGKWEDLPPNPIYDLLNHSDCDGDLSAEQCGEIGPRLIELLSTWPEEDYDREQGMLLASMMATCFSNGRKLVFC